MNINISDEMIEQILEKQIREKVKAWFAQTNHTQVIKELIEKSVLRELNKFEYMEVIREEARKQVSKKVLDGVCKRISTDIAEAFADKYGDY